MLISSYTQRSDAYMYMCSQTWRELTIASYIGTLGSLHSLYDSNV